MKIMLSQGMNLLVQKFITYRHMLNKWWNVAYNRVQNIVYARDRKVREQNDAHQVEGSNPAHQQYHSCNNKYGAQTHDPRIKSLRSMSERTQVKNVPTLEHTHPSYNLPNIKSERTLVGSWHLAKRIAMKSD